MPYRFPLYAVLVVTCCGWVPASPAMAGEAADSNDSCGYASTEAGNVPNSLSIFQTQIVQIDGRPAGMQRYQHRLAAGKHILVIAENIKTSRLNSAQTLQIAKMQRHSATPLKALILDVRPGTSYRIGARLIRDRLDTQGIRDNAYWEPVVWDEVAQSCP